MTLHKKKALIEDRWKNEVCGTCYFYVNSKCRKDPPRSFEKHHRTFKKVRIVTSWEYPEIEANNPSCSHWRNIQ